jgi:hypothetical protein
MEFFRPTWVKVLIVAILVLVVGSTVIYSLGTRKNQPNAFSQPTPSSQALTGTRFSPTIVQPSLISFPPGSEQVDSTTIRKTYTNDLYHYSFQYPNDWGITDSTFYSPSILNSKTVYPINNPHDSVAEINVEITTRDFANGTESNIKEGKNEIKPITVSGIAGDRTVFPFEGREEVLIIFPYKQYSIIISADSKYEDIFNIIFSSFQIFK